MVGSLFGIILYNGLLLMVLTKLEYKTTRAVRWRLAPNWAIYIFNNNIEAQVLRGHFWTNGEKVICQKKRRNKKVLTYSQDTNIQSQI